MRRRGLFVIALIVIILIIIMSYRRTGISASVGSGSKVVTRYINLVYETDTDSKDIEEVQQAVSLFPVEVVEKFIDDGWKIAIVKDIDGDDELIPAFISGQTDYGNKTITIQSSEKAEKSVLIRTCHEFSHYLDTFYGNAADQDKWIELYEENKDYREYEYAGALVTEKNRGDIEYATSDRYELFACSCKDYLLHPDYLYSNYPNIFMFFRNLLEV